MSIKSLFRQKPMVSNQHGALAMAFVPFLYGMWCGELHILHLWLGLSWLCLYLFSYPFLVLFQRKPRENYRQWAALYASLSLLTALPVIVSIPAILQFLLPIFPLAAVQIYYAKQKNERHLINDISGYLIFGIIGLASYYVGTQQYRFEILLHPTLFFIATTFYVKSVARERKNPRYFIFSLVIHLCLSIGYAIFGQYSLAWIYMIALCRAGLVPRLTLNIKQIGLLEFPVLILFLIGLILSTR